MKRQKFSISPDFIIQRWRNGIKLAEAPQDNTYPTIETIFKANYSIYFLNTDSQNQLINEAGMELCGFNSPKDSFNKSIFDLATYDTAIKVANTHRAAMHSQQIKLSTDYVERRDGYQFRCITGCFPWYNAENKITGVFGCSVTFETRSMTDIFTEIINIGGFHVPQCQEKTKNFSMLSRREHECMVLLAQGLTAKKIACSLNLSPRTVEHYIENIKNKVGVSTKHELIVNFLKLTDDKQYL